MTKIIEKYQIYFLYLFAIACATSISVMTGLLFLFLIFYLINLKENFKTSPKDFIYYIVFYIWASLTTIFNLSFSRFFMALNGIWDKIPYITFSAIKLDEKKILNFLKILLWANAIILIYALLQKYADFPVIVKKLFTSDMIRFKGYHSHPLRFAGYISTVLVIGISFAVFYSKRLFLAVSLVFLGVILTLSRSYWFSCVIVSFVLFYLKSFRTLVIYVFSVLIFIFLSFIIFPELKNRVIAAFDENAVQIQEKKYSNMSLRKNFWKAGFEISMINPIWGIGKGNISKYLQPYKDRGLIDNVAHCHNIYITALAETGIIGVGILVFIIFYFIRKYFLIARFSDNEFTKAFAYSVFAGWLNVAVAGFFESNFSTFVLWGFFSVWMGMFEGYWKFSKVRDNLL